MAAEAEETEARAMAIVEKRMLVKGVLYFLVCCCIGVCGREDVWMVDA